MSCFCGLVGNLSVESELFLWSCGIHECGKRAVSVVLWETCVWKASCFCGPVGNTLTVTQQAVSAIL